METKSEREWQAYDGREQTLALLTVKTLVGGASKSEEVTLMIVGERDRVAPASAIATALAAKDSRGISEEMKCPKLIMHRLFSAVAQSSRNRFK